jgi:hypothetical protein
MIRKLIDWCAKKLFPNKQCMPDLHEEIRREQLCGYVHDTLVQSDLVTELYKQFPKGAMVRKTLQQQQIDLLIGGIVHSEWLDGTKFYMSIEVVLLTNPSLWVRVAILQNDKTLTIDAWSATDASDLIFVAFGTFLDSMARSRDIFFNNVMAKPTSVEKPVKTPVLSLVSNRGNNNESDT